MSDRLPLSPQAKKVPKLRHHKPSGRAYVELSDPVTGKRWAVYCGKWRTAESRQRYAQTLLEWESNNYRRTHKQDPTVATLCADYLRHAKSYYCDPQGNPTSRVHIVESVVSGLVNLYGKTTVADFGPLKLAALRQSWIKSGLSRKTINDYIAQVRAIFKWGVSREQVPSATLEALRSVRGLTAGRSGARETEKKKPVPQAHIKAVKPYVSRQIWALIQLQLLTSARGGELVGLRACDLDMSGKVWLAKLDAHKTAWRGHEKTIYLGSKAQVVVREFLHDRPIDKPLFSPREAVAEIKAVGAKSPRRPNQKQNNRKSARVVRDSYSQPTYRRAVERACEKAGIPAWQPHRLRHNAATMLKREVGPEAAQVVLGLASGEMLAVYAERDRNLALSAIGKLG